MKKALVNKKHHQASIISNNSCLQLRRRQQSKIAPNSYLNKTIFNQLRKACTKGVQIVAQPMEIATKPIQFSFDKEVPQVVE